jgi:hypothetical protein
VVFGKEKTVEAYVFADHGLFHDFVDHAGDVLAMRGILRTGEIADWQHAACSLGLFSVFGFDGRRSVLRALWSFDRDHQAGRYGDENGASRR